MSDDLSPLRPTQAGPGNPGDVVPAGRVYNLHQLPPGALPSMSGPDQETGEGSEVDGVD